MATFKAIFPAIFFLLEKYSFTSLYFCYTETKINFFFSFHIYALHYVKMALIL